MNFWKKDIILVKVGDPKNLLAKLNYSVVPGSVTIKWQKRLFTEEELKEERYKEFSQQIWMKKDDGQFIGEGMSIQYKFEKADEGKYIKFYALVNQYIVKEQAEIFYLQAQHDTAVRIKSVKTGPTEAQVGELIKYIVGYSQTKVSDETRKNVKWMVRIEGKDERLIIDDKVMLGEEISFIVPQKWQGKDVLLMPYLNKHTPDVSLKTRVKLNFVDKEYGEYFLENSKWQKKSDKGKGLRVCIFTDENNNLSTIVDEDGNSIEIKNGNKYLAGEIRGNEVDWDTVYSEWSDGNGPATSYFENNHKSIVSIKDHSLFEEYLKKFKDAQVDKKAYQVDWKPYEVFTTNMQAQMMGSYNISFYKLGNKILCLVNDSKSRTSFYLHLPINNYERNELFYDLNKGWIVDNKEANTYQNYLFFAE